MRRARVAVLLLAMASALHAQPMATAGAVSLPFSVGERFTFTGRTELLGNMGRGAMWIEGPDIVRGVSTWMLRFEFKAGIGPLGASENTTSWIDAQRMAALRFEKHTRKLLKRKHEVVEMFPEERRWTAADGKSGKSLTSLPLDELSFIYFIRTLPLQVDSTYDLERHFDAARNPTVVRVVGREVIATQAGQFNTIKVEMIVKDSRNYEKEGMIRFYLSDDLRRIPVRIESVMPGVGLATLTLESHSIIER